MIFVELRFKQLEQCESIGSAASKASYDLIFVESSDFAGIAFHDRITH